MTKDLWAQPSEVDDVDLAFPARALELMPSKQECDAGLDALTPEDRAKWLKMQNLWFAGFAKATVEFFAKPGVDPEKAFRHLSVIQGSFAPRDEHKTVAVAYLASRWIDNVEIRDVAR